MDNMTVVVVTNVMWLVVCVVITFIWKKRVNDALAYISERYVQSIEDLSDYTVQKIGVMGADTVELSDRRSDNCSDNKRRKKR